MNRNETSIKLLPKSQFQDLDKDELPEEVSPYTKFYNMGLAPGNSDAPRLCRAGPRIPLLQKGDIVTKDISARPIPFILNTRRPSRRSSPTRSTRATSLLRRAGGLGEGSEDPSGNCAPRGSAPSPMRSSD